LAQEFFDPSSDEVDEESASALASASGPFSGMSQSHLIDGRASLVPSVLIFETRPMKVEVGTKKFFSSFLEQNPRNLGFFFGWTVAFPALS
jgi:hypothetical protein